VTSVAVTRRADLTNAQWAVLEPLLPLGKKPGRPPTWTKRQLIDGIRWRIRAGAPWRDVPPAYGSWQTVYGLFRRWQRAGIWAQILSQLHARADAAGLITWDVSVDSTVARAHQHAAGARKKGMHRPNRRPVLRRPWFARPLRARRASCKHGPPLRRWSATSVKGIRHYCHPHSGKRGIRCFLSRSRRPGPWLWQNRKGLALLR